jgi:hypothetical protein
VRALAAGGERNTDDRPFVEYRAPRDMIEVGRDFGSRHPGIASRLSLPVVPPDGSPIASWPREAVLLWRARQRLASADPGAALAVATELGASGVSPDSLESVLRRVLTAVAGERAGDEKSLK